MKFIVTVPDGLVSKTEFRDYIRAAIEGWSGQFHPDDELFGLRNKDVRVAFMRESDKTTKAAEIQMEWRAPLDLHKDGTIWFARNEFEKQTFQVAWNEKWECWVQSKRPHIVMRVDEIYVPVIA